MAQAKVPPTATSSKKTYEPDGKIRWISLKNTSNEIHFSDGNIMIGLPNSVEEESTPTGKVLLCMLAEIMILREKLEKIEIHFKEPPKPEFALGAPVKELKSEAMAFRDKAIKDSIKDSDK